MQEILSMVFTYHDQLYQALVRCKPAAPQLTLYVTIIQGELESRLFGYHIFSAVDHCVSALRPCPDENLQSLQQAIIAGLEARFEEEEWKLMI